MLSRGEAQTRAERHASTLTSIPLALTYVHPTDYGWVFCFNSKVAEETGDESEDILGLGPLLVMARDGTVIELGTAHSLERELRAHEEATGLRRAPET